MLPSTYLDRVTRCMGLRMDKRGGERRKANRIPATFRPEVFPVSGERIMPPTFLRARDISASGIALVLNREIAGAKLVIVRVVPRDGSINEEYVMLCTLRRHVKIEGGGGMMAGFTIDKVLYPGQRVAAGQVTSAMLWVDVAGEKVGEDPFLEDAQAA